MVHNQLHAIDLIIIAAYLISMVLIGVVVVKKVQSMDDYYLGGRSFGPLVLMATVCATIIGGSGLMGRAGVAYSSGFKAIMTALPYLLGMFIFSGFAGRISAVGTTFHVTSIPDLFEQRFGKTTKVILGGLIAFTMMGTVASQVTATATIINMLGNEIGLSYEMGALIACVVFIVYTATSGLFGVIYTDVFQFVMLILFVYILIPSASLVKLGGLSVFLEGLAPELAKPYLDGGIVGDIITYFVFTLAGAEMWQRAFAAKSQKAAKEGLFLGTLAYGLTIPLVWFMGVVAHQLVSAEKLAQYGSTDAVVPALAIEILPVGLTGLALAGILSVIMSTADSYLIVSVQTCVHDIYKVFNPNISEKKELRLTRVFAVILPLGALVIALYIKNAYSILMFAWSFYAAAAGLPAFAALYWKKATKAGIIAGMVAGFTVCVGWKLAGVPFGLGPTVPGAIACAAALVGVSPENFFAFYATERTDFSSIWAERQKGGTAMDDTQIIDLYWDRDQGAITATAGKYGSFLHALSWNILRSHHDAEECVNDTYFRAWNAIPPERPSALRAWLGRITRNLSLDRWKAGRTQSRGAGMETLLGELDECIPDHRGPEQAAEERVLAECVSAFLRGQTADNRYIFLRRYWYGEDIAAIAKRLDCGESRVKSVLFRTRKALRAFLEKEGITV